MQIYRQRRVTNSSAHKNAGLLIIIALGKAFCLQPNIYQTKKFKKQKAKEAQIATDMVCPCLSLSPLILQLFTHWWTSASPCDPYRRAEDWPRQLMVSIFPAGGAGGGGAFGLHWREVVVVQAPQAAAPSEPLPWSAVLASIQEIDTQGQDWVWLPTS